jgi:hypothetical protein
MSERRELKSGVERRAILDSVAASCLTTLLTSDPELATARMEHCCD